MTLQEHLKTLPQISEEDVKNNNVTLQQNEFLLRVRQNYDGTYTGFMAKLNQNGTIPVGFSSWGKNYNNTTKQYEPIETYLLTEEYRNGWKFIGLRNGQSSSWVVIEHPFGFKVEINGKAFQKITDKITMVNGDIVTPCYFEARAKNAELLVKVDDRESILYQIQQKILDSPDHREKFLTYIKEEFPVIVFTEFIN